jgi:dTDP-4-amino-4,6-dideoxygalactose transaminase
MPSNPESTPDSSSRSTIPFNRPFVGADERTSIEAALGNGHLSGDGPFSKSVHAHLETTLPCPRALLTHSCTAALEMAAILSEVGPGDEVILPSYTFVSTANAFVLRGATPVFVDIRPDTLNLDESQIEAAITPETKAIVPVHYAGVGCEMETINAIADAHQLIVIEDAAQGVGATYRGRALGTWGDLGTLSFHETKNVISGEGGALLVNRPDWVERAEVIREKGTNRSRFFRGEVDKYTWVDVGSSYLPSDLIAAVLLPQLRAVEEITQRRLALWNRYHEAFAEMEARARIRRPQIPEGSAHNAHLYSLLLQDLADRTRFMEWMKADGIHCPFHYVPLHSSPMGRQVGRVATDMTVTDDIADRLVRLPLWVGLEPLQDRVIERALGYLRGCGV